MNEHADNALLVEAYYAVTAQLDEPGARFVEHAPNDPDRQYRLQSKLMTAVLACFIRSMPSLTDENYCVCEHCARYCRATGPDEPTSTEVN
jgi:hypothetical protein